MKFKTVFLIFILAFILRFYHLGSNPPGLDWDETAHGFNAYSILKTGRDEYGYKLPLFFRSFDDYKPPLYTYLVVPSIMMFGLTDFAVRFPSALLGSFAVVFTYLMVYELFRKKEIALLASFFLAVSPWHLQFSRVAFETNSAIFWSVLGTWAFLKAIKSKGIIITAWTILASIAFGLNLFVYHNARVFVPFYSVILLILFRKFLIKWWKLLVIPALIALIFSIILIPIITSISGQLRFKGTAIFSDVFPIYKNSTVLQEDADSNQYFLAKIIHNRRFVYIPILIQNYLSHSNPIFLFFNADMDRHHAPLIGLLYLLDLPFILAGIYLLIKKDFITKSKIIVLSWFLLAPVAASVTKGVPHSLRTEIYLPTFQIFIAIGLYYLLYKSPKRILFLSIYTVLFLTSLTFYLHQYYIHMPQEYSESWLFGRKEAVLYTESLKQYYDRIIVSTSLEQPHEFWLFYSKYDPKKYLKEGGTVSGGFQEDKNKFDKYLFKPINYQEQSKQAKTLFVGNPQDYEQGRKILKKINYLNNEPAIYIWDNN